MGEIIELSAWRRRTLRTRAIRCVPRSDSPAERYKRARLKWELNPIRGTTTERYRALLAVLEAREGPS